MPMLWSSKTVNCQIQTLHPDKCKVVCVKSGRKNALLPPIYLHGKLVEQVSSYSHLGVTIHQTLTWTEHVQVTTSKSRKVLGVLRKVMGKLGRQALETAYFALVRPKLEYGRPKQHSKQDAGTGAMKGTPYSNLLQELEWDTLSSRRQYNSLTIMYRMTKGLVPPHLQSLTPPTRGSQFTRIQLRNNTHLCVPRCRTQAYKTSFIPHTSSLWNQLPQTVRDASNLAAFKRASKKHLLTTRHHQMYRTLGSRPNNIRTTRLRVGWCQLNSTLYKMKIKGKACVCADLLQLLNDLSNNVPPFPSYFKAHQTMTLLSISNFQMHFTPTFHHLQQNQCHSFKLESTDILDRETRWWERDVKKAIYERMYNPSLNREGGYGSIFPALDIWHPHPREQTTLKLLFSSQDHTAAELMHVARILNGGFFPLLEGTSSAEGASFLGGSKVDKTHRHAVCRGTSLNAAELTWLQQAEMSDIVHFATNPSQILANIEVSGIGRSLSTVDRSSFGGKGVYYSLFSRTWNDSFST
ncbi:hypothetical protein Bbelb_021220 [Branchiostoma belcheri]|nr:hypothetical protein Bbelb_021220 [Branchiostoma belcheri]